MLATPIGRFRLLALAEAVSWIGLLLGMFVKHVLDVSEIGVKIFGPVHGGIFVLYVIAAVLLGRAVSWDRRTYALALVSSIPPLGSVVFERWATKTGRMSAPEPAGV